MKIDLDELDRAITVYERDGRRPVGARQRWFFRTPAPRALDRRRENVRRGGQTMGRGGRHA